MRRALQGPLDDVDRPVDAGAERPRPGQQHLPRAGGRGPVARAARSRAVTQRREPAGERPGGARPAGVSRPPAPRRAACRPRPGQGGGLHVHGERAGLGQPRPLGTVHEVVHRHDRPDVDPQPGPAQFPGQQRGRRHGMPSSPSRTSLATTRSPARIPGQATAGPATATAPNGLRRAAARRGPARPVPGATTCSAAPRPRRRPGPPAAAARRPAGRPARPPALAALGGVRLAAISSAHARLPGTAERAQREDQPVQVVVDVEVAGEAGAGEVGLIPGAVGALGRDEPAPAPAAGRVGPAASSASSAHAVCEAVEDARPGQRHRRRSAGPRPSRRRRSGGRPARAPRAGSPARRASRPPRSVRARRRRCRKRSWRPSARTTSRRAPGRGQPGHAAPRPGAARPATASISTTCAVTSALGGSITSPKSQKGSLVTGWCCRRRKPPSRRPRTASRRPAPPARWPVGGRPGRPPAAVRRSARTTSAVSSMSG